MAVQFRAIGATTSDITTSSITLAVPTYQSGDYLVAFIHNASSAATADATSSGWTRIGATFTASAQDTRVTGMYAKFATSSEPSSYTFTFDGAGARSVGFIASFTGVDQTTPVAASSGWSKRTSTTSTLSVGAFPASANYFTLQIWAANFASPNSYAITNYGGGLGMSAPAYNPSGTENTAVSRTALMAWAGFAPSTGIPAHTIDTSGSSVGAGSYLVALTPAAPKAAYLTDDFDDSSLDTNKWSVQTPAIVNESGGKLNISPADNTSGTYGGYATPTTYDLTGSQVVVQAVQGLNSASSCESYLRVYVDSSNYYSFLLAGSTYMTYRARVAGTNYGSAGSITLANIRWWRLRESGGTIYWDTSTDGVSWTNQQTRAADFSVNNVTIQLFAGTYSNVTGAGTTQFDNLGLGLPKVETLTDNYDDNSLNTSLWYDWSTGFVTETGSQLRISPPSNNPVYGGIVSNASYNFVGSLMTVQCVQTASNTAGVEQYAQIKINNDNAYSILWAGNNLLFRSRISGINANDVSITWNATTMAWWRIRERNGMIFWETSANGASWTVQRTLANVLPITTITAELGAGTYQNVATPGTAIFDNFNVLNTSASGWLRA